MPKPSTKVSSAECAPNLPPRPKIATEWNLNLFYTSVNDPALETDMAAIEAAYAGFARKYKNKKFLSSPEALARSLHAYTKLQEMRLDKPLRYLYFVLEIDATNSAAEQKKNLLYTRLVAASSQIIFYPLAIARIEKREQSAFLKHSTLQAYRYYLQQLWLESKYLLTEAEERIMQKKAQTAHSLWVEGTEKILAKRTIVHKKKTLPLLSAIEQLDATPKREKAALWTSITAGLATCEEIVENELNAICIDKQTDDTLRGYTTPEQATILGYENDPQTVDLLIDTVSKRGFALSRSFYQANAKALGVDSIQYVDRYNDPTPLPEVSFTEAVDLLREVFYSLRTEYGTLFDSLLGNGQIDVYPRAGKQGGGFMSSGVNEPTMIKLNHVDTFSSLMTIAHEMGHAIHSYRSQQKQPAHYQGYSTTTAETASTLFEQFVFAAVYERTKPSLQSSLLHRRLTNEIAGTQRQVAFYNFERALHAAIRTNGGADQATIRTLLQKQLQAYLGTSVQVSEDDARSYVYVGHFRNFFYVYTYAYGHLVSSLMYQRYLADSNYLDAIDDFLSAGGSTTVEQIYKQADIDVYDPHTFASGLELQRRAIATFKKTL